MGKYVNLIGTLLISRPVMVTRLAIKLKSEVCFRTGRIHTGRRGPGRKYTLLFSLSVRLRKPSQLSQKFLYANPVFIAARFTLIDLA